MDKKKLLEKLSEIETEVLLLRDETETTGNDDWWRELDALYFSIGEVIEKIEEKD